MAQNELLPLYVVNDVDRGGFGFSTRDVGFIIMMCAPPLLLFQALAYKRIVAHFGLLRTERVALLLFSLALFIMPYCSLANRAPAWVQWLVIASHMSLTTIARVCCFISVFVLISNSATTATRGLVNGIGQSAVAITRMFAPELSSTLYAWSASQSHARWPLDFHLVFYIVAAAPLAGYFVAASLPATIEHKRQSPEADEVAHVGSEAEKPAAPE